MFQGKSENYVVTRLEGDGSFVAMVSAVLTEANWAHTAKSSRVVAVRSIFLSFLRKKAKELTESGKPTTIQNLSIGMASGLVALTTTDLFEIGIKLQRAVNFKMAITESDCLELVQILNKDYAESNDFLTVALWDEAKATRLANEEQAKKDAENLAEMQKALAEKSKGAGK